MEPPPATILYPEAFKASRPAGFDGVYDWGHWAPAIALAVDRGIAPMDIDAAVEINGHYIIAETKNEGVKIPLGQHFTLNALVKTGLFTVIKRWGKIGPGAHAAITYGRRTHTMAGDPIVMEAKLLTHWASWASNRLNSWRLRAVLFAALEAHPEERKKMLLIVQNPEKFAREADGGLLGNPQIIDGKSLV